MAIKAPSTARRLLVVIGLVIAVAGARPGTAQAAPVGLGTADSYAVLAGSTITNTGPTTITGDVGLHPGDSVTGFASVTQEGALNVANPAADQAKSDLVTAYVDAAGQGPTTVVATELGGEVLLPGVYASESGTFEVTGTLTLDAQDDPDATFVFQTESSLMTATASGVDLIGGATACNIYWQVGSSATLGTGTDFRGTILALTSIHLTTGATLEGRALARNGEVTMDTNTITRPDCEPASTTTTSEPTSSSSTSGPVATTTTPVSSSSTTPGTTSTTPVSPSSTTPGTTSTVPGATPTTADGATTSTPGATPTTGGETTTLARVPGGPGTPGDGSGGPGGPRGDTYTSLPSTGASLTIVTLAGLAIAALGAGSMIAARRQAARTVPVRVDR